MRSGIDATTFRHPSLLQCHHRRRRRRRRGRRGGRRHDSENLVDHLANLFFSTTLASTAFIGLRPTLFAFIDRRREGLSRVSLSGRQRAPIGRITRRIHEPTEPLWEKKP